MYNYLFIGIFITFFTLSFYQNIESNINEKKVNTLLIQAEDCTFNDFPLYGKIQFVENYADIKIKIVESFPDLKVKIVDSFPDECGEWQIVDSFPDLKVKIVESFADLKIKFVESFPGLP